MRDDSDLTLRRIPVPETLEHPDAAPLKAFARLANAVCRHDAGHDYLDQDDTEVLGMWQATDDRTHVGFTASRGNDVVGAVALMVRTDPGTAVAEFDLLVEPALWGEGVEQALLAEVEREAGRRGIRVLQTWTLHRPRQHGERLAPVTGWGSVPAEDRQTRFQLAHGYRLEQVERNSVFDLHGSLAVVERMRADAEAFAGPGYRVVEWTGSTPPAYLEGFARVVSRMSTDAPQGGLDVEEQAWDADRVRRRDARLRAQGLTVSIAAVLHEATGDVAAYNELQIGEDRTGATQQHGTLVLSEHRGRRLGTIVKCANLMRWRTLVPESPRVSTFNAEENRHMLAINEAIGFRPASYAGGWQKNLIPGGSLTDAAAAGTADNSGSSGS